MINLNIDTIICIPIQKVFDFVSNPENDSQWQYGTLAAARISEGSTQEGTFFRSIGHLMGRRNTSTFEVTEYEPNKKYGFKSLSGPLLSRTLYVFEMAGANTRVNISTNASIVHLFRVHESILKKQMKKQLKENLSMLKNILEATRVPPAPEAGLPVAY